MLLVKHRVNTIELLKKTPKNIGVEIDIRSYNEDLILHHEPFSKGVSFNDWLKFYEHSFIILNVKEEGLEEKVLLKMKENNVKDDFDEFDNFKSLHQDIKKEKDDNDFGGFENFK